MKHNLEDTEEFEPENQKKGLKSFMSKFLSNFVEEVEVEEEEDEEEDFQDDEIDDDFEEEEIDDDFEEVEELEEPAFEPDAENSDDVTVLPEISDSPFVELSKETDVPAESEEVPPVVIPEQVIPAVQEEITESAPETDDVGDLLLDAPEDMPEFRDEAVPGYVPPSDSITLEMPEPEMPEQEADAVEEDNASDDLDAYFPQDSDEETLKDSDEDDEDEGEDDDENDEDAPKKKNFLGIAIPVALVLVLGLGFAYCFQLGLFDEKPTYVMPDFVGKNYYELGEDFNNFDIQVAFEDYSTYDKDVIYSQDIPAGTEVKLGQTVNVNLSLGYAQTKMPDVRNYQFEYAQKLLEQSGFEVEVVYEASLNGTAQNNVIRTLPASGEDVNAGAKVTMYVSEGLGADAAQVQTFTGMLLEEAEELCEMYGLRVEAVPVPALEPQNVVVEQSIEAGTKVPFHTVITLAYSSGEQPQGTVDYQLNFPAYASGRFILDFININGEVVASSDVIVAGFSAVSMIPVQGTGSQEIKVVLNNYTTNLQAELGTYSFDFTTGTYAIIDEDIEKAFQDVKGIG